MPAYSFEGFTPVVDARAFVHPLAVLIGDVRVGPDCYVAPGASLRGDFGRIILGAGSNVQDNCVLHSFPGQDVLLEEGSHVGHGAVLHGREFSLLLQRLGEGPARVHVDIHTDDLAAETYRLERLGAERVQRVHRWQVMRDPAGLLFCVVPDPPGTLDEGNARRWE